MLLRELGIPVVVVEQNADAKNVARGKDHRLPIVIGSGASQRLLRRLSIGRARAIAAVTSDEVENIAISIAAQGIRRDVNIVLRAGDVAVTKGPRWLFGIGVVRDVYRIAASALAATILAQESFEAFPYERVMYLVDEEGRIRSFSEVVRAQR
jgi:Trk K+ transport system NAD-binding subunit